MIALPDVNVLVALAWQTHEHHAIAHAWLRTHAREGWATCPMTETGFVRVSMNPRAVGHQVSLALVLDALERITAYPHHRAWHDDIHVGDCHHLRSKALQGHKQVTDAYLLCLAKHHGGHLVTFDAGMRGLTKVGAGLVVLGG